MVEPGALIDDRLRWQGWAMVRVDTI